MGSFGGYYAGEKKKKKKTIVAARAKQAMRQGTYVPPKVEIIGKGKDKSW